MRPSTANNSAWPYLLSRHVVQDDGPRGDVVEDILTILLAEAGTFDDVPHRNHYVLEGCGHLTPVQ